MTLRAGIELHYIVIGENCWGKGPSEHAAKTACRKASCFDSPLNAFEVWLVEPDATVGLDGDICWNMSKQHPILLRRVNKGRELPLDD